MKVFLVLVLLASTLACGKKETKKQFTVAPRTESETLKAPAEDKISFLSQDFFPEKIALYVNQENIFDECQELPADVKIDRDIPTIDMNLSHIMDADKMMVEIRDRGADCTLEKVWYINENVDREPYQEFDGSLTIFARLNNFPSINPEL